MTIEGFTHTGPGRPAVVYRPEELVTEWSAFDPLSTMHPDVEAGAVGAADEVLDDRRLVRWRSVPVDRRGAVVTARVTEFRGTRRMAYFRSEIPATQTGPAVLEFSTTDALAIWLNGSFLGFAAAGSGVVGCLSRHGARAGAGGRDPSGGIERAAGPGGGRDLCVRRLFSAGATMIETEKRRIPSSSRHRHRPQAPRTLKPAASGGLHRIVHVGRRRFGQSCRLSPL